MCLEYDETDLDREESVWLEYFMQHPNNNSIEGKCIYNVVGDCSNALVNRAHELPFVRNLRNRFISHPDRIIGFWFGDWSYYCIHEIINSLKLPQQINEQTEAADAAAEIEFEYEERYNSESCNSANTGKSNEKDHEV